MHRVGPPPAPNGVVETFSSTGKWSADAKGLLFDWGAATGSESFSHASDVEQSVGQNVGQRSPTSSEYTVDATPIARAKWDAESERITWNGMELKFSTRKQPAS